MKKLFLGICLFVFSPMLFAQSISGKITDAVTGEVIAGASIQLVHHFAVSAGSKGDFRITPVKPGNYALKISAVGYNETQVQAQVPGAENLVIRLNRTELLLQPIEVKATRASEIAPFSKTNLTKKDLEKNNIGQDLPFLLQQTPSMVVSSDAGNGVGYTGWRIRGTDVQRINMTINGIPYNDPESHGTFFVNLPDFASSVSSVQIQRGVGTSTNGAGAFGGTINFSTNEFNEKAYGEANNSYGSFNTWKHTVKAGSGLLNNHFTIDARFSKIASDGFVDRATSDLKSAYLSAAWLNEKSSIRLNVITGKEKTYQSWNGLPESKLDNDRTYNSVGTEKPGTPYDNETDNYQQDHYQLFYNQELSSKLKLNTAFFLSRGRGYYEQYKADQSFSAYGLADPDVNGDPVSETDLIRQLWLDNHFYGGIFSLQYKNGKHELTYGGGVNQYDGKHYGKVIWAETGIPKDHEWYNYTAMKRDFNTYAKWQFEAFRNFYTFADLQFRYVKYDIDGFRSTPGLSAYNQYRFFNPKAGVSYLFGNGFTAFASYSIGQKEPNRDDFEAGALSKPKHELLRNIESGLQFRNSRYQLAATFYHMDYKNQLIPTGKINDVGAATRVNIPDSYRMGIELEAAARLTDWASVSGNLTLSRNKVKNITVYYDNYDDPNYIQLSETLKKADIAFSPSIVSSFSVDLVPFKHARVSLPGKYVGRQYLDNTSRKERSLDDFYVQDLRMQYSIQQKLVPELTLMFHVNNVFDRKYEPNGYTFSYQYGGAFTTENYYYPMAGVNWMVGANIRF